MNQYDTYSNLWTPDSMQFLFIVKAPSSEPLAQAQYKALMEQRVVWMIQQWMDATSSNLQETQRFLATSLGQLHPSQDFPILDEDDSDFSLQDWQQAWAETLVRYNHAFSQALNLSGISFPLTVMTEDHPKFLDYQELHQESSLDEWLTNLTSYA